MSSLTQPSPEVLSLNDLKVELPSDVHHHLATQSYSSLDESASDQTSFTHLDQILNCMKTSPADTCCRVNLISSTIDEVVDELKHRLSSADNELDATQEQEYTIQQHETLKDLVIIRANTAHDNFQPHDELFQSNRPPFHEADEAAFSNWEKRKEKGWPMSHRAIIVDRFCGEAVLRGANVFVKGILCADSGISVGEEVAVYADLRGTNSKPVPRGLVLESYPGRCVFLGIGISCCKRSDYFAQSTGVGIKMKRIAGPSQPSLNGVLVGKMMLQNLPSVVVAHVLDPQQGETVLDMCSAPGGKTSHVASLIRNNGLVVACEKGRKKMVTARDFFQSMGATCIVPLSLDSTKLLIDDGDVSDWKSPKEIVKSASASSKDGLLSIKGFHPNSFDRILLDPPCSALGLRPKLLVDVKSLPELLKHSDYQQLFVRSAVPLLKVGGVLSYSTCTINASENEGIVKFILSEFPCMKLVPIADYIPGRAGLEGLGLSDEERGMVRRFDPSDTATDTMGFFVAKFIKIK